MKTKLIYLLAGAILLTGMFFTRIDGIDKNTLALIERAMEMDLEEDLWPGYKLSNYPIDVNYGKVEFKYYKGEISKQKPSLGVLALSAYPEEDGPVVKIIPDSMVRKVIDIIGNMDKNQRDNVYISIIFHEGLHAFQIENGAFQTENGIEYDFKEDGIKNEKFTNILYRLDNNDKYKKIWLEEQNSLVNYYENTNDTNKELWIESYNKRREYLKGFLGDEFEFYMDMENERELIEGTARYVEDKILEVLSGEFSELDIDGSYYEGVGKFYTNGRLKCLILDKGKDWKKGLFNSNKTLTDLLI